VSYRLAAVLLLSLLAGCATENPSLHAERIAAQAGFQRLEIQTVPFRLLAYVKGHGPVARVYIEGDGHAWIDRYTRSDDPTPRRPIALELAAADPTATIAWLARPCQYLLLLNNGICLPIWWTDRRYHDAVINSVSQALDTLRVALDARRLELVGFSGGGAVAALVAARRTDVVSLRTVAADLDTDLWTRLHQVTPLKGSLNPADVAARLGRLPQLHLVGADDEIVGPAVVRSYLGRMASDRCAVLQIVPGMKHDGEWRSVWSFLLRLTADCRPQSENFIHENKLIANDKLDFVSALRNNHSCAMGHGGDS
jgi:pimeloyl-ACP methyl ester carboxylesterase